MNRTPTTAPRPVRRRREDHLASVSSSGLESRQALRSLHALVARVEADDVASAGHSDRVGALAYRLALAAGWSKGAASRLHEAALVHDVGKIALRRDVLAKPGRLDAEEYEHVQSHAVLGERMLRGLLDDEQLAWVRQHHERWDGGGYPDGLQGIELSEGAALLAAADSFDAMTSPRAYKQAMGADEGLAEACVNAGRQFSPAAVIHLLEVLDTGARAAS
jgi:HD-GYP domain-containing protein (c-di-GMP phosphodiesterase class II)